MFVRLAVAAAIVALFAPGIAQSRELELTPSSKWLLSYDQDSCTLARSFGEGDQKFVVQFVRFEPSADFDLNLYSKRLATTDLRPTVALLFGTGDAAVSTVAMKGRGGQPGQLVDALFLGGRLDNLDKSKLDPPNWKMDQDQLARLASIDPAVEVAVTSMSIRLRGKTTVLRLGSMGPPMAEMRKCTTDLVQHWGLKPEEQEQLAARPVPRSNPGTWLNSSDYPSSSLIAGEQAIIRFRLMVDEAGIPTTCAVQSAIARGTFAQVTCDALRRRASFEPARNAAGAAVASYYVGKVRWIVP